MVQVLVEEFRVKMRGKTLLSEIKKKRKIPKEKRFVKVGFSESPAPDQTESSTAVWELAVSCSRPLSVEKLTVRRR